MGYMLQASDAAQDEKSPLHAIDSLQEPVRGFQQGGLCNAIEV